MTLQYNTIQTCNQQHTCISLVVTVWIGCGGVGVKLRKLDPFHKLFEKHRIEKEGKGLCVTVYSQNELVFYVYSAYETLFTKFTIN